ncbi:hypothetical protein [Pseudomonas savastanoi]|nr:hypothetical protein [Pseudomonas savastanoi]
MAKRNGHQTHFKRLERLNQLTQSLYTWLLPEITLWGGYVRHSPAR